jgi:hypothetical protein
MVAPQKESSIDDWIQLAETLSPVERLALAGLLSLRPQTPISIISPAMLNDPENISAAEKWLIANFRKAFSFYCERHKQHRVKLTSEAVKRLAPILVGSYNLPLGIAVGFLFWAIDYGLQNWCEKYGARNFNGEGKYSGGLPESPAWPNGEVRGVFDVTYLPPITEIVDNPESYPLKGYKVVIKVPAETTGAMKVPSSPEVETIVLSFKGEGSQSFTFTDTAMDREISGDVRNVFPKQNDGPNVLGFTAADIHVA